MSRIRHLLLILLPILLISCGPKNPAEQVADLPKRVYLDANLGFAVTIPEQWNREFVRSPEVSGAPYEVRWVAELPELPGKTIEVEVALFPPAPLEEAEAAGMEDFILAHPGFNLTARNQLEKLALPASESLGHTSRRNYQIFHIATPKYVYQIACSVPPEVFDNYVPLFREIIETFTPLN